MSQERVNPIVIISVLVVAGYGLANSLLGILEIYRHGVQATLFILTLLSIESPSNILIGIIALILIFISLTFLGLIYQLLSLLLPAISRRYQALRGLIDQIEITLQMPRAYNKASKNTFGFIERFFEGADPVSLTRRALVYVLICIALTLIAGLILMLISLRYPDFKEFREFLSFLMGVAIFGVGISVWISGIRGDAGSGPLFLTHVLIILILGTATGIFVLPGAIFFPWLIVSIVLSIPLYCYLIIWRPGYDIERGCFFSTRVYRSAYTEEIERRSIYVPVIWTILIFSFVITPEDSRLYYPFFMCPVLSLFAFFLLLEIGWANQSAQRSSYYRRR